MPTTRFTELPEQAQKELDELEKYIRLENQRNEYIKNHKIPRYFDTISQSKKSIDLLSQVYIYTYKRHFFSIQFTFKYISGIGCFFKYFEMYKGINRVFI